MARFCGRRGARAGLDTIRCFTSSPSRKPSRNYRPKRKTAIATAERPFASCLSHFPPCYSLGSYGDEISLSDHTTELQEHSDAVFVFLIALARQGIALAVVTDLLYGEILRETRGALALHDALPIYFQPLKKTFAELSAEEKNRHSHRGKAFRKLFVALSSML